MRWKFNLKMWLNHSGLGECPGIYASPFIMLHSSFNHTAASEEQERSLHSPDTAVRKEICLDSYKTDVIWRA